MSPDEFRQAGHEIIELIAQYREQVEQQPVRSKAQVGEVLDALPASPPDQPEAASTIIGDVQELLMPHLTHWQHPSFHAYFPANAELSSVLGDLLSSGLGQLGLNWQSSPPLTEVEQRMCEWLQQMLGLSANWSGVIHDTASTATLVALLCARERATRFASVPAGGELTVYGSAQAHSSVVKAALLAGYGRHAVRTCAINADFSVDLDALCSLIESDVAEGRVPGAIVGCTGTTATTAMDDIDGLADLAAEFDCWLHVDGAMAGSAMLLPEMRHWWAGIERADSVVFNPHKWLGAVFDCSVYFVRDPEHLIRVMSTNPSYLQTSADGDAPNYRDWGIPLGRRFRSMKLWWLIRSAGVSGLQKRLRRDLDNAQWLAQRIEEAPHWRLLAPVSLQTVCVVHEPPHIEPGGATDEYTQRWCEAINASGVAMLTPAQITDHRGQECWMVRVSIGALGTEREHIEKLWGHMQRHTAA
jgi:aromatic-L-amino-acid decarboxylase